MATLMYFIIFLVAPLFDQTHGYDITLSGNAVLPGSLEIHLNIGIINSAVNLNRPDGSLAGSCGAPIGGVLFCGTDMTQNLTSGTTTYSIASVSRTADEGVWTSSHGTDTGSKTIRVLTIPTLVPGSQLVSSMKLSLGTSNTQALTVTVTCAYPTASLGLSFVPTGGGTAVDSPSSTSTCSSTGNTGCTDTVANSYTCDITPQYETTLAPGTTYYVQVAVNLDGQYQSIGLTSTITDTEIIVQGTPTPIVPPKCSCSWLPCGWKCYYMYIIIVAVVVVLVVLVISVCCCCRHGYCTFCTFCACCRGKDNKEQSYVVDNTTNPEKDGHDNPSIHP